MIVDDSERQANIVLYHEHKTNPWFPDLDERLEEIIESNTQYATTVYLCERYRDDFLWDGRSWYHRDDRSGFFVPTGRDSPALQDVINIKFLRDVDRYALQQEVLLNNLKRNIIYEIEPMDNVDATNKLLVDRISRALTFRKEVSSQTTSLVKALKSRFYRLLPARNISLLKRSNDRIEQWVAMNLVPQDGGYLLPAGQVYEALGPKLRESCSPAQLGEMISRLLAPDKRKDGGIIFYEGLRLV